MEQRKFERMTRCQAITNLIDSVAKEEEAIAKILETIEEKEKPWWGDKEGEYVERRHQCYEPEKKEKKKDDDDIKLINALTRLNFIITSKLFLFVDCACPNEGCNDNEKPCPHR